MAASRGCRSANFHSAFHQAYLVECSKSRFLGSCSKKPARTTTVRYIFLIGVEAEQQLQMFLCDVCNLAPKGVGQADAKCFGRHDHDDRTDEHRQNDER